ncbi:hypothetical protein VIGAN_06090000, partial [Vigna angularis var. angularis]
VNVNRNKIMSLNDEDTIIAIKIDVIEEGDGFAWPLPVVPSYDWASREVGKFVSNFNTGGEFGWFTKHIPLLKAVDNARFFKLIVCKKNDRMYHGKMIASHDFFFKYSSLLKDLLVHPTFNEFQISVLRELNVARTPLHSNGWSFVQAFKKERSCWKRLLKKWRLRPNHRIVR